MVYCVKILFLLGLMFIYKVYMCKGFLDVFICMNRYENISYNLKMCLIGVVLLFLFWEIV